VARLSHTGCVNGRPPTIPGGARGRLDAIETAYSDAEHDLITVLTQPTLFDLQRPAAARFHRAWELTRQRVEQDPRSWTAQQSVADLESSWLVLRTEARHAGISQFSRWQKRRIRRAGQLFNQARSDRGSPRARFAQYFRGLQLLNGLVELPGPLQRELYEAAAHTEPLRTPGPDFPTYW
jgi:hypothetical protein